MFRPCEVIIRQVLKLFCIPLCVGSFISFFITSAFLFNVNEFWNGSFLYTVVNVHAIYSTTQIFPCMVGFETPIHAQSNITDFTVVYSLAAFVMLAADITLSCWFAFLFYGRYSWKVVFCQPVNGVVTIMVTWHSMQHWMFHQQAFNQVYPKF